MYTNKILKIRLKNLNNNQNNYNVTLTIQDLNKIIKDVFNMKDNMQIEKVILLEDCFNEKSKASRKIT